MLLHFLQKYIFKWVLKTNTKTYSEYIKIMYAYLITFNYTLFKYLMVSKHN